ncbi:MAG: M1 family metallopeptidase [Bacteroidales bacterium]|nr:M1 family metallopeptidase [Bacteroidales bacterium]MCF8403410.1 M1 family metallopeptidase [Bacteroidales bacterium]
MKDLSYIIIMALLFLGKNTLSQIDFQDDEPICKHQHFQQDPNFTKSIINPNPLVFNYDVTFYKLNLEAYDTTSQFTGYSIVQAKVTSAILDTFSIELSHKLEADSVFINGVKHLFTHASDNITVELNTVLSLGELIEFKLYYHTPPDYSSIYYSASQAANYGNFKVSQTFSEPYFVHEWMPCKQELEDKADSVHIFITTKNNLRVAGPGLLTTVLLPDNMVRHEWRTNNPTAFYLIFFAISDYQEYNIYAKPDSLPGDSILVMNYVYDYPNCLESNLTNINSTAGMIELFSDIYGLFPFYKEKYGHYLWYPGNFSGMEHITMTGMRYFSFDLIAHELGHSWFGDNVTCATWSDIWINEGFATYTEYLARQYLISQASADSKMLSYHNYVMATSTGSVYVPPESTNNWGRIFSTRLTYRKGGSLLHMIRFEMQNDSIFFRTLYEFQQQFKDSLATGLDFKNMCEQISGKDFDPFFNQWYFGEGWPTYNINWWQIEDTLFLRAHQTTSTPVTPLFQQLMEYKISFSGSDTLVKSYQLTNDTILQFIINGEALAIEVDPNNWVLNAVGNIIHEKNLNIKAFLEGSYDSNMGEMKTLLQTSIPQDQPYSLAPWNYNGSETMTALQYNTVDWVLILLYDTTDASLIANSIPFDSIAGFITATGNIVDIDGKSYPRFTGDIEYNIFAQLIHRNHLSVLSSEGLLYNKGVYSVDFSSYSIHAYGGADGVIELSPGVWGLISGDANADGQVTIDDKSIGWENHTGDSGYLSTDLNMDTQTNNRDKDDFWLPNLGKSSQVPQ